MPAGSQSRQMGEVVHRRPISPQGVLSDWEVVRVRALRGRGVAVPRIAAEYGVDKRTIYRYLKPDRYRCQHCDMTFATAALAWTHVFGEREP